MLHQGFSPLNNSYPCCFVTDFFKTYPTSPPSTQRNTPSFSIDSILARDSSTVAGRLPVAPAGPSPLWAAATAPLHYHYAGADFCGEFPYY
ncbi:uncharacterized protein CEXT_316751 [Caerostris extrusa]|uniref:Uncharacterized protein n=1 Tax=Caerostris extrusa TaxID=172846 RepID=A0AAV4UMF9_CAEEX|nr:uncharacterized protein CEXT_316751 [Caerostris extrusa]